MALAMAHDPSPKQPAPATLTTVPSDRPDSDIEKKAIDLWVAATNAAVKNGEAPPVGDWDALPDDLKRHYHTLADGIQKSRDRGN